MKLTGIVFINLKESLICEGLNYNISNNTSTKTFKTIGIDWQLALRNSPNMVKNTHIVGNILIQNSLNILSKLR